MAQQQVRHSLTLTYRNCSTHYAPSTKTMQAGTASGYAFICTHGREAIGKVKTQSPRRVSTKDRCKGDAKGAGRKRHTYWQVNQRITHPLGQLTLKTPKRNKHQAL